MKRIISALLTAVIITTPLASCGGETQKSDNGIRNLYFKDSAKNKKAAATFLNSKSGKTKTVKMKKISSDKNYCTFLCKGDTDKYNMVYFNGNDTPKDVVAFNKCTNGWYKTKDKIIPYSEGGDNNNDFEFDVVTLKGYGYEKKVHIWKPYDYDASSKEKYSTIYVLDGQNVAYGGKQGSNITDSPRIIEQVKAMTEQTGVKAIVVAIENVFSRDNELVPKIGVSRDQEAFGEVEYESMDGTQLGSFTAKTLVPYIRNHYNVYKDALHTSIEGSSLGGLEAFYMTVEYPNVFGTAGAVSPSFWMFKSSVWNNYLKKRASKKTLRFCISIREPLRSTLTPT